MIKIKTLFKIEYDGQDSFITEEVNEGCEWVVEGEGWPEIKLDGTACLIREDGSFWKRYDAKPGRNPPATFIPCMPTADPITGHNPGWIRVLENDPNSVYHRQALEKLAIRTPGTYELVGRHINSNPYNLESDHLVKHGSYVPKVAIERTWDGIRDYLEQVDAEGLVFHHRDGRMVKIRRRDYGFDWPIK